MASISHFILDINHIINIVGDNPDDAIIESHLFIVQFLFFFRIKLVAYSYPAGKIKVQLTVFPFSVSLSIKLENFKGFLPISFQYKQYIKSKKEEDDPSE